MLKVSIKRKILPVCLCLMLIGILVACSYGSSEYVRLVPPDKQPIAQFFEQSKSLVSSWSEFLSNFACKNDGQNRISYNFKIRPELQKKWPVNIVLTVNLDERILIFSFHHPQSRDTMTPEVKQLFDELLNRLRAEFGETRVIRLDISNNHDNQSEDMKLLTRLYDGVDSTYKCTSGF